MKHYIYLIIAAVIVGIAFVLKGNAMTSNTDPGAAATANNPANRIPPFHGPAPLRPPAATFGGPIQPAYPPGQAPLNLLGGPGTVASVPSTNPSPLNPIIDYNPNASVFSFDQKGATSAYGPTPWIPTIQPVPLPPTPALGPMPYPITGNIYGPAPIANNLSAAPPDVVYADSTATIPDPTLTNTIPPPPSPNGAGQLGATPSSFWAADGITNDLNMDPNSVTA